MQPANKRPSKCCVYIRDIKWCLALPPKEWAELSSKTKPYWEDKRFLHGEEGGGGTNDQIIPGGCGVGIHKCIFQ